MGRKQKIVLPPELPPETSKDEVEVSDEDLQFINENRGYAGFVSNLDTHSITRHVSRVADVKEDALEALYERRLRKNSFEKEKEEEFIPSKLRRRGRGLEVNGDESPVLGGGSNVVGMRER